MIKNIPTHFLTLLNSFGLLSNNPATTPAAAIFSLEYIKTSVADAAPVNN